MRPSFSNLGGGIVVALLVTALAASANAQGRGKKDRQGQLKEGDPAPNFTLQDTDGKNTVTLSKLKGKPAVLIFGSCTWPPFVRSVGAIEKLYATYKDRAHIYVIYIREAHPVSKPVADNPFRVPQPKSLEERRKVARDFAAAVKLSIPVLVDDIENRANMGYTGWPDRIYIIDADGKVAHKGGPGPGGFSPSVRAAPGVLDKLLAQPAEK